MKKLLSIGLFTLVCGVIFVPAQPQEKCFQFGALKDKHIFRFEADGGDVAGSYSVEREYDAEQTETYDFSGKRTGNTFSVKFAKYAKLQGQPYEINSANLTLVKSAGSEILKAKFYGKSKTTVYSIDLESCKPGFASLAQSAGRISFAKGAKSATLTLSFKNQSERRSFWLKARQGQTISVISPGCGISFYYPDKTVYEEGTAIDTFGMENIRQSGDYLFVLSPAGETAECSTIFKITN